MQNGASLLDIAEIITMDNISMIKSRLEGNEQKRMEQQQAMEQAQNSKLFRCKMRLRRKSL